MKKIFHLLKYGGATIANDHTISTQLLLCDVNNASPCQNPLQDYISPPAISMPSRQQTAVKEVN